MAIEHLPACSRLFVSLSLALRWSEVVTTGVAPLA